MITLHNNEITTQKGKRKNFLPHRDLNHGHLVLKASVLLMSYTDPHHQQQFSVLINYLCILDATFRTWNKWPRYRWFILMIFMYFLSPIVLLSIFRSLTYSNLWANLKVLHQAWLYTCPVCVFRVSWLYASPVCLVPIQTIPPPKIQKLLLIILNSKFESRNRGFEPPSPQSNGLPTELSWLDSNYFLLMSKYCLRNDRKQTTWSRNQHHMLSKIIFKRVVVKLHFGADLKTELFCRRFIF